MNILALESSAKAASVAVCADGRLLAQYFQESGLTHSKTLLKMTEDLLANLGLSVGEMDLVAVAHGPGSFTGVRIGVAAAKGLAWAADIPAAGVSSLFAMAFHLLDCGGVICPVMDARRGQVYNAKFIAGADGPDRLCPDRAITVSELMAETEKDGKTVFLVGDGARLCYNAFLKAGLPARLAPPPLIHQSAWGVAMASHFVEAGKPDGLIPQYLRPSQAERERLLREETV